MGMGLVKLRFGDSIAPSGLGGGRAVDPGLRRFAPYPGLSYVVPSAHGKRLGGWWGVAARSAAVLCPVGSEVFARLETDRNVYPTFNNSRATKEIIANG